MPFLERGVHADSLAAAMTDLEDQSGVYAHMHLPFHHSPLSLPALTARPTAWVCLHRKHAQEAA